MENNNRALNKARQKKFNEFFTTYEAVESEVAHYEQHLAGKFVLCPCNDLLGSNFCRYFLRNFYRLGLSRLVCISYALPGFPAYALDTVTPPNVSDWDDVVIDQWLLDTDDVHELADDGDFHKPSCLRYLQKADAVVTNPPFSLFRSFLRLLMDYQKRFLILGNYNAVKMKGIFPLFMRGEVWAGWNYGNMEFRTTTDAETDSNRYWVDDSGRPWRSFGNIMWYTNMQHGKQNEKLKLVRSLQDSDYPFYDGTDAIEVSHIADIPYDFNGLMGVPITYMLKHNPTQFEIVGLASHASDGPHDLFEPRIDGKLKFDRIIIRRRNDG